MSRVASVFDKNVSSYKALGSERAVVQNLDSRPAKALTGPKLCTGAGIAMWVDATPATKKPAPAKPAPIPAASAPTAAELGLTPRVMAQEILKGAWSAVSGVGASFKKHPYATTAVAVGVAALLFEFPICGAGLLVYGTGSSLWEIYKGLKEFKKGVQDRSLYEADAGLEEVGQGALGVTLSAVAVTWGGLPSLGSAESAVAAHAADASKLNPAMLFHAIDDLPVLLASLNAHQAAGADAK